MFCINNELFFRTLEMVVNFFKIQRIHIPIDTDRWLAEPKLELAYISTAHRKIIPDENHTCG